MKVTVLVGRELIVVTAHGRLDLAASEAAISHGLAGLSESARTAVLFDLRGVDCGLSLDDVPRLLDFLATQKPQSNYARIAILMQDVARRSTVQFFLHSAQHSGYNVQLFDDIAAASAWTGADVLAALGVLRKEGAATG